MFGFIIVDFTLQKYNIFGKYANIFKKNSTKMQINLRICKICCTFAVEMRIPSYFSDKYLKDMQYDMQRLERMTLEELRAAAEELGVKVKRAHTPKMIAYLILDAQADKRAADVEAKEAEKSAKRSGERQRKRVKTSVQRVNTDKLVKNDVIATVGNEIGQSFCFFFALQTIECLLQLLLFGA